jgi:hypothetical protein
MSASLNKYGVLRLLTRYSISFQPAARCFPKTISYPRLKAGASMPQPSGCGARGGFWDS